MPYSLHEKSGLASIPFNPNKILEFSKEYTNPSKVKVSKFRFLDKKNIKHGEAAKLINNALKFQPEEEKEEKIIRDFEEIKDALPEQFFPPCIKKILKGLEDGRKRALFTLVNFLTSVGWNYDKIELFLKEWNNKNTKPLREIYIKSQLRYHKQQKKKILPPNCSNKMYYQDIGICTPDNLCSKIKNPVNYSRRRVFYLNKSKK